MPITKPKIAVALTALTLSSTFGDATEAHARPFTIAVVSSDVSGAERDWRGLLRVIERAMASEVEGVALEVFNSYGSLLWDLWDGRIDAFVDEPVRALNVAEQTGAEPLAVVRWLEPENERACLVTTRRSDIFSLADLAGEQIAFDSPSSTFGHALPALMIEEAGVPIADLDAAAPPDGAARFLFTMDRASPVVWLQQGRVEAAAAPLSQIERIERNRPGLLRVLRCSAPAPRFLLVARDDPRARPLLREALEELAAERAPRVVEPMEGAAAAPAAIRRAHALVFGDP